MTSSEVLILTGTSAISSWRFTIPARYTTASSIEIEAISDLLRNDMSR